MQRWKEHADGTAEVLNKIDPHFIRVRNLIPQAGSYLFVMRRKGDFTLPPPDVILQEERRIIEHLDVTSEFLSDHISNYLPLNGQMPQDKTTLLSALDREIANLSEDPSLVDDYRLKESLRHL